MSELVKSILEESKQPLIEGISFQDNKFVFNFNSDKEGDIVPLKYSKSHTSKKFGFNFFFGWSINFKGASKEECDLFRKSIKNNSSYINPEDKQLLINKAVIKFDSIFDIASYDIIIYPKSSSSLVFEIAKALKAKSTNTILANDVIVKNKLENIKIDYDKYISSAKTPEEAAKRKKDLDNDFKRATKDGNFQIKKVHQFRKGMFSNYMVFDDKVTRQIFNSISNGRVIVVDDIFTTGTTIKEIMSLVNSYTPSEATCFILLK